MERDLGLVYKGEWVIKVTKIGFFHNFVWKCTCEPRYHGLKRSVPTDLAENYCIPHHCSSIWAIVLVKQHDTRKVVLGLVYLIMGKRYQFSPLYSENDSATPSPRTPFMPNCLKYLATFKTYRFVAVLSEWDKSYGHFSGQKMVP